MKLYLTVIGIAMTVIAAVNIAFGTASWYYAVIATVWCTALQFAFDGSLFTFPARSSAFRNW